MATRKPKVGDAAIIDGGPAVVTAVNPEFVEFKCPERIALEERIARLRAMPQETEEEQIASNAAKVKFMAEHETKMPSEAERIRLVSHGHALPGGMMTKANPSQVFWVGYSEAWSCNGRLLPRADIVKTHVVNGVVCDVHDENEECIIIAPSVRRQAKIHRRMGEAYNPRNEIAAHIAHITDGVEA